jgi:predicted esterase
MEQVTFRELMDKLTVLYRDGKHAEALEMIEQNTARFPEQSARTTFWRMCLLSLCNRPEDAVTVLEQGLESGLWWAEELFADPDLNAVRDLPEFKRLMATSKEKHQEAQTHIDPDYTILEPEPSLSGVYPLLIALHGHNGNKDTNLEHWEVARHRGWLVLSPQSTQAVYPGAYHWDDAAQGLSDLLSYYEQISQKYQIDSQRVVIGGFSQGSGMAIYAAVKGTIPVRGFIGIGTWWANASELAGEKANVRGYFITGEKDHTLDRAREIQDVLRRTHVQFSEEVHADIGHEFPADFGSSFDRAVEFISE